MSLCRVLPALLGVALLLAVPSAQAEAPEGRLLRFPHIHGDTVVFVYAGDVWTVASEGGEARRLTSDAGLELFPKISPDGKWVAFSAEYTGTRQVYVMPLEGGPPKQLTFYNDAGAMPPRGGWDYWIQGWTPDGKILVRMNRTPWGPRPGRYYLIDPAGGLETPLPFPHAGSGSMSPDGTKIVYTPMDREFRTWKRTKGGRAQDIWIYDLNAHVSERLTTYDGTDNFPMWWDNTIYFTSDREHTLNIYARELGSETARKVTDFNDYDVLWPALGGDTIVFMNGGYIYRLDLPSGQARKIPIQIGNDLPATVPHFLQVGDFVEEAHIAPDGARAVFEARGDLFTVPAKDGPTRNLTRTQGVRERSPAWSPDGKWIAYLSDRTGEYEIYLREQDGSGDAKQITKDRSPWRYTPAWSPDSKKLAFGDRDHRLRILDVDTGRVTDVDTGTQGDLDTYAWSPDSKWLAYEDTHPETDLPCLSVYSLKDRKSHVLGDGLTSDFDPVFSHDGQHLFFLSNRDYNLRFSDFEFNYIYDNATSVFVTALHPDAPALFPMKSDEVEVKGDDAEDEKDEDENDEGPSVRVEPEGFVDRTITLPGISAGNYAGIQTVEGAVFYRRVDDDGSALFRYDLGEREESKVMDGVRGYVLSSNGKKLLYRTGSWGIVDAKAGQSGGELSLTGMRMKIDPRAEWAQLFEDAWRIGRDWFYDPDMHGVDWDAMHKRYGDLVPHVAHRADLDFLFGEMVGELQAGHTYVQSGDQPSVDRVEGGMLGAEFEADKSGRYRIAKIYPGENWNRAYRSPLTEPGVDVNEGDFLLAIDGEELKTDDNPFRLLEGKANQPVILTVNDRPVSKGARTTTVRPVSGERNLRYLDWVRGRMELADRLSGGRVGYIHLPNTAVDGNRMLQKLFYSQSAKDALIVDDRYNGGGFIPDRMIEMLSRTTLTYWARRGIESFPTPGFAHDGPKAMLINGFAASGGDALPYYFRLRGLGPLVGTRTWGGLIGLSGNPGLADGGSVLYPMFRIYDTDGRWVVENEGVAPDHEVHDLPERLREGGDPSLEKAVELMLEALKTHKGAPDVPRPPDMER